MATDQQVALTRAHRIPSTSNHISKAARQVVPAFLQKLYEMVNNPNDAELIRWSESGDSFFVLDQERFAHEVLGRWFKHRNFSSFVRQLNMYGFHKIPHLQQGVLKSDTDTEFWNFAHANFHRGQPDLLCLIQRKKQAAQQGDESTVELRDGNTGVDLIGGPNAGTGGAGAGGTPTLSNGQVLDVHSIISGINAIKRHQTTISAELNELKRSNQLLWQDALSTRTRHQKQQDTINRIVKFLAGVFGSHSTAADAGSVSVSDGSPGVDGGQHGNQDEVDMSAPRRRMRFMIEDSKRDGPSKSMIEELTEIPIELDSSMQYQTQISAPSPTPSVDGSSYFMDSTPTTAAEPKVLPQQPQPVPAATQPQQRQQEQQEKQVSRAVTPTRSPTMIELDPRINMFSQLSPSQIQQFFASLAPQTIKDPIPSSTPTDNPNASNTLTQYQPVFDFSQFNPHSSFQQVPNNEGLILFDQYDPQPPGDLTHPTVPPERPPHEQRTEKQWRAADNIDKDVSAIDTSINSLIEDIGLDPAIFEGIQSEVHSGLSGSTGTVIGNTSNVPPPPSDFDFETFFNNLSNASGAPDSGLNESSNLGTSMDFGSIGTKSPGVDGLTRTAVMDEVHTPTASSDVTASPTLSLKQVSPEITITGTSNTDSSPAASLSAMNATVDSVAPSSSNTGRSAGGKKRKSDMIVDTDPTTSASETAKSGSGLGGKAKRRKDK